MTTYILALMLILNPAKAPKLLAPHTSYDDCMEAAIEATKDDHRLRTPEAQAVQVEYVCLKVIRITI